MNVRSCAGDVTDSEHLILILKKMWLNGRVSFMHS